MVSGTQLARGWSDGGVVATPRGCVAAPLASRTRSAATRARRRATAPTDTAMSVGTLVRRFGTHNCSAGSGRLSSSRRKTRSMLSSGNISHLRAHPCLRLCERRADRAGLDTEMPRDLAVIQAEIELRDD